MLKLLLRIKRKKPRRALFLSFCYVVDVEQEVHALRIDWQAMPCFKDVAEAYSGKSCLAVANLFLIGRALNLDSPYVLILKLKELSNDSFF